MSTTSTPIFGHCTRCGRPVKDQSVQLGPGWLYHPECAPLISPETHPDIYAEIAELKRRVTILESHPIWGKA
jgi:hypothetical protein